VRLVGPSSVDEMVLAFLRAEVDGPRYQQFFANLDRRLLVEADLTDAAQNRVRWQLLDSYRGGFIGPLPTDTQWQRWALTRAELGDVRYANHVTWQVLSGKTRRVRDGAANVRRLVVVAELGVDVGAGIRETAKAIDAGHKLPELIAVATDPQASSPVLVEGHTRATAYLIATKPPTEIVFLIGWSRTMTTWPWF